MEAPKAENRRSKMESFPLGSALNPEGRKGSLVFENNVRPFRVDFNPEGPGMTRNGKTCYTRKD